MSSHEDNPGPAAAAAAASPAAAPSDWDRLIAEKVAELQRHAGSLSEKSADAAYKKGFEFTRYAAASRVRVPLTFLAATCGRTAHAATQVAKTSGRKGPTAKAESWTERSSLWLHSPSRPKAMGCFD